MNKVIYTFIRCACLIFFISLMFNSSNSQDNNKKKSDVKDYLLYQSYNNLPSGETPISHPDFERHYFEQWHYPYGAVLPQTEMDRIWNEIKTLPSEEDVGRVVNSWSCFGPFGMNTSGGAKYTGRVLDIEVEGVPSTRLAAASGGLWRFAGIWPIPMTDALTSQAIGSFDSKPGDANTIFVGTGEPYKRSGTGLWRTTNGGINWIQISMSPNPSGFYRIRYQENNTNIIHAATTSGYFRSDDGGATWTRRLTGHVTDLAFLQLIPNVIYTAIKGDGLYKSTNNGTNWSKLTGGGIPTTNVGRTSITMMTNILSTIVYVSMAREDNNNTLGVYRSTNNGSTWSNRTPPENFMSNQGYYNNTIGVSPTNGNIALVGGVTFWRTTNGGSSWTKITDENMHADQHATTWHSDGERVWVGNDGGMSYSNDKGVTWSTASNVCPITQYDNFDVGVSNTNYRFGGSQDNGVSGMTSSTGTFYYRAGGDGGGVAIDPVYHARIFATNGLHSGDWLFWRLRSVNSGLNWTVINNGIEPSNHWGMQIRHDKVSPIDIYNNSGPFVYRSTNYGDLWTKLNTSAFPCDYVRNITVSRYVSPGAVVYACLHNSQPNSNKLRVYDNGAWFERSTGFPTNALVRTVATHITDRNIAYALMNGTNTPGQKIFYTSNRGQSWTNMTGNLPNVPLGDLVRESFHRLYVGSGMGCYRTTNAGLTWHRWNNGMPEANIITEMDYIDSSSIGKFYIVAATYGRGMWIREGHGDDPTIVRKELNIPNKYELKQNYPNPFNPTTTIEFLLPTNDRVELNVFDISGRQVASIINGNMTAGIHEVNFDGSNLTSGVYFYQIRTSKLIDAKKMLLIK